MASVIGLRQLRIVPQNDAALRTAERLAGRPGEDGGALIQGVLELPAGDKPGLVGAVVEEPPAPLGGHGAHFLHRQRKQRHGHPHGHQLGPDLAGRARERIQVDLQLDRVERNVHDVQAPQPRRPVEPVAGVPSVRLGHGHDGVPRPGQGLIDGQVAEHAAHQPVVGVAAAEGALEQLGAQRLDLVDELGPGKPAVHPADVAFGRPRADLRGQQPPHRGAGGGFGRQQVDAALAAPFLVFADRRQYQLRHLLGRTGFRQQIAGPVQQLTVVDFEFLSWPGGRHNRPLLVL